MLIATTVCPTHRLILTTKMC